MEFVFIYEWPHVILNVFITKSVLEKLSLSCAMIGFIMDLTDSGKFKKVVNVSTRDHSNLHYDRNFVIERMANVVLLRM